MIKRLKRRFVIVNMSILTCVLISILVTVFIMMYSSEVKISNELLESIMSQMHMEDDGGPPPFMKDNERLNDPSADLLLTNDPDILHLKNDIPNRNDFQNRENTGGINRLPWEREQPPMIPDDDRDPPDMEENDKPDDPMENSDDGDNDDNYDDDEASTQPKTTSPPDRQTVVKIQTTKAEAANAAPDNPVHTLPEDSESPHNNNNNNNGDQRTVIHKKITEIITTKIKDKTSSTTVSSSVTTKISSKNTPLIVTDEQRKPLDDLHGKMEMDPFRGKVKRSYIYVSFKDVSQLEKIVYKYNNSTSAEDDDAVKQAAIEIFNNNDETGTITLGDENYRYLFRYEPPKMQYSIVFLDRTLEIDTINRLLFIFLFIGGGGLVLIFLISVLLANWTIKPVERAWTQQKEFIANASHELKTPLTVISTNTDVVLSSPNDTVKEQSKWLNYIKNETSRMAKLVNSLLYIAKYDANKIELIYSQIDLSDLLSSVCLQYEPLAFEKGKKLFTDIDKGISINADEDKIKQLINILMDNALKYSLENGFVKVSLKVPKPSSVCMTISNNSEFIDSESIEKLFDRFYRVDDSRNRKTGGSGLGLNIAKTIVESHKGTIRAMNKNNITAFIVTLNK